MIMPMMGLLFFLFVSGLLGAVALTWVPTLRPARPFVLVPISAAVGAFVLSWGIACGLDAIFHTGLLGFFSGYCLGGLLGAGCGFFWALCIIGRAS